MLEVDPACFEPVAARAAAMAAAREPEQLRLMTYNLLWGVSFQSMVAKDKKANAHPEAKSLGGGAAGAVEAEQPAATVIASVGQLPVPIRSRCYREHVIVRELLSFASDVACLQEVTPGVHDDFLVPLLRAAGFESTRVRQRPGSLGGELAVVWKTRRLVVEAEAQWTIADLLGREWNADLLVSLEQVPYMLAHVVKQPQQAQVVRFRDLTIGRTVVVVNLHLSAGDSTREHLRALQACLVVREVQCLRHRFAPVLPPAPCHIACSPSCAAR